MKRLLILFISALLILPYSCTKPSPNNNPGGEGNGQEPQDTSEVTPPEPPQATYSIGEIVEIGLSKGIVVSVDTTGTHGLMISLDETIAAWSTEHAMLTDMGGEFSHSDGYSNMQYIKSLENWKELYPAFAWCDQKNVLGLNAWYIPSLNEFEIINTSLEVINESLSEAGFQPLATGANDSYWTSVEVGVQSAYAYSFYYGEIASYDLDKMNEHYVRAMRSF